MNYATVTVVMTVAMAPQTGDQGFMQLNQQASLIQAATISGSVK